MIEARLPDGTALQFEDGTSDAVIDRTVKSHIQSAQPQSTMTTPEGQEMRLDETGAWVPAGPTPPGASVPTLEDARSAIQRADMAALQYLKPGPDESAITSVPKKAAMVGVHGLSLLAQTPVNALLGLTQGPRVENGQITVPALRMTDSGTPTLTPEAQTTASFAATPLRFGPRGPVPSPGTFNRDTSVTGVNQVDPAVASRAEGRTAFRSAQGEAPAATSRTGEFIPPPREATPVVAAGPLPDLATSAGAKRVANYYYRQADELGGTLTPQFTDRFIDSVDRNLPQTEIGRAVAGESEAAALARRLQDQRGKPMTLQALQEADEGMTALISKEWGPKGISKDGLKLQEAQRGLRDQIMSAGEGDIEGGAAGFEALANGRRAWSAAMLLRDLEAIQERASRTEQPSTSIRTQVRTLLGNANKTRWYSPEEVAALEDAAQRGVLGGAFHIAGSRLVPIAAAAAGLGTSGPIGALIQGGAAGAASAVARNIATKLQERRLGAVAGIVSQRVPTPPPNALMGPLP